MRTKSCWALGVAMIASAVFVGCSSSKNSSTTGYVYVAAGGDQKLTAYSVNLSSGATSQLGGQVATGVQPSAMALTPDGNTLFLANTADNTIGIYTVNSDKSVKAASPASVAVKGQNPVALAVDPSGKFLFVANQGTFADNASGTISVISISNFQEIPGSPFLTELPSDATGTGPTAVVTAPVGNFLYVANQFTNTVGLFSYDGSTGALSSTPPTLYSAGANPSALAFSRCAGFSKATAVCTAADGNNLFVANSGSNNVSAFTACIQVTPTCSTPDGSLAEVAKSPFAAGVSPVAFIVNPLSDFLYVIDSKSNEISQYQYSSATGALSPLSPSAVSTASTPGPGGITINGSFVFVPDTGASTMSIYRANSAVSSAGAAPSGRLSPSNPATINLTGQPSVILAR